MLISRTKVSNILWGSFIRYFLPCVLSKIRKVFKCPSLTPKLNTIQTKHENYQLRQFLECRFPEYNNPDHVLILNTTILNPLDSKGFRIHPSEVDSSCKKAFSFQQSIREKDVWKNDVSGQMQVGIVAFGTKTQTLKYANSNPV